MGQYCEQIKRMKAQLTSVIVGKEDVIEKVLMTILAGGHILMEDIPGVGKTTMALAFSRVMDLDYQRVQFTPDVLPSDVVGFSVLNQENQMEYKPGAVFCNLFLADEINRTSPKTQSALLEVMEEGTVSVDGNTFEVPKPFVVMATQNPVTSIGTQLLPESQLDRFMVKLSMGYPAFEQEIRMLKERQGQEPLEQMQQVMTGEELYKMQEQVQQVFVHDSIYHYITSLVAATREHPQVELGVSPRGSLALTSMAKASAYLADRDYVIPEDVERVFLDVTAHRLVLTHKAKMEQADERTILEEIQRQTKRPDLVR